MNYSLNLLLTICILCFSSSVFAQTNSDVDITIETSGGTKSYTAPVNGHLPLSMEAAMQSAGVKYTVSWFPSVPGYAVMILEGEPSTTNGGFGVPFWWACVNGYSSAAGMQTLVKAGDNVTWKFTSDGKCPNDP